VYKTITRRRLLHGALLGAAGSSLPLVSHARTVKRVVISGWGGATQRAMRRAFFTPFTQATGIEVEELTYASSGLARLKAQLREGVAQVDLLDGPPFWPIIGREQGLLEKITLPGVDKSHFIAGAIEEYSFGYSTVSWGITYLRNRKAEPRSWSDFWDTRAHPGKRAFFGPFVARHVEYALMADGLDIKDVNPLDDAKVERAFRKLSQIKPHVAVWYQTPAQCERLLLDRQIDMAEFFNGRAFFLKDQGVPLEFEWNQAITNLPVFVLAKHSPNREYALQFLQFLSQPEPQAAFAQLINYGPTNLRALPLIKNRLTLERMPTFPRNFSKQLVLDGRWWGENQHRIGARWSQLLAS
jgi:putative spermidine/putrescine transport system substrate-binding protein